MTVVVPTLQYEDLPSFGWSFIVRQDLEAAIAPVRQLVRSFWISFLSASVAVMILLYFVAGWIAVPLTRLALFTEELAGGKVDRPAPEAYRYAEARRLSNSLARLQSQLESVLSNKERWQKIRASLEASENRSPPKQASG
jgi:HAMP domain-containing protein